MSYPFLVAAILVAIITLMRRLYRRQARQGRQTASGLLPRRTMADRHGRSEQVPDEVVRWEVRMHDLARELTAELESKMVALGHLIRDADRAASRLEGALAGGGQGAEPRDRDPAEEALLQGGPESERPGVHEEIYLLADYGFSPGDIASRAGMPIGQVELILRLRRQEEHRQVHGPLRRSPP